MKIELTRKNILAHPLPPAGKRVWMRDSRVPGLAVRITSGGSQTFYLYKRVPGYKSPQKIRLGTVEELAGDMGAVRALAATKNLEIAAGKDPVAEKKAKAAKTKAGADGATLKTLWVYYLDTYAKVHKRPTSIAEDERMWKAYLSEWADRPLSEITFGEVNRLKVDVAGTGDDDAEDEYADRAFYMANRVLALLSKMFAEGCKAGIATANPVAGVERFPEQTRERHLNSEEIKALFIAMKDHQEPDAVDFIKLALATGARRGMLRAMEWSEVNMTFNTWTVPAAKMKGGKAHTVPLVPQAMEILQHRRAKAPEATRWVFPGAGPSGHLMNIKKSFTSVLKTAGISGVRLHDLRRTVATWMNSAGANDIIIASLLAHSYRSVTGVYARVTVDTVRQALSKAVDAMWTAAGEMVMVAGIATIPGGATSKRVKRKTGAA